MARVLAYTSPARGHLFPLTPILPSCASAVTTSAVRTLASEVAAHARPRVRRRGDRPAASRPSSSRTGRPAATPALAASVRGLQRPGGVRRPRPRGRRSPTSSPTPWSSTSTAGGRWRPPSDGAGRGRPSAPTRSRSARPTSRRSDRGSPRPAGCSGGCATGCCGPLRDPGRREGRCCPDERGPRRARPAQAWPAPTRCSAGRRSALPDRRALRVPRAATGRTTS